MRYSRTDPARGSAAACILFLLALACPSVSAGKLYKWVDESGQVHFSQSAPEKDVEVERMEVQGGIHTSTAVRIKGEYEYCGSLKLPGPVYDERRVISRIVETEDRWNEELRHKEQDLANHYRQTAYKNNRRSSRDLGYITDREDKLKQEIDELRCRAKWAQSKKADLSDFRGEITDDLERSEFNYRELSRRARQDCGPSPAKVESDITMEQWEKCMSRYDGRIARTKRDIERLKLQINQFSKSTAAD